MEPIKVGDRVVSDKDWIVKYFDKDGIVTLVDANNNMIHRTVGNVHFFKDYRKVSSQPTYNADKLKDFEGKFFEVKGSPGLYYEFVGFSSANVTLRMLGRTEFLVPIGEFYRDYVEASKDIVGKKFKNEDGFTVTVVQTHNVGVELKAPSITFPMEYKDFFQQYKQVKVDVTANVEPKKNRYQQRRGVFLAMRENDKKQRALEIERIGIERIKRTAILSYTAAIRYDEILNELEKLMKEGQELFKQYEDLGG